MNIYKKNHSNTSIGIDIATLPFVEKHMVTKISNNEKS
ncbi:hypothetical protein J2780_002295 [Chryseobacterium camelliae]|nr:hypothetical protein [Chryseobacterium camelliae]